MAQSHDTHDATSPSSKRTSLRSRILLFPQPPTTQSSHASQTPPPDRPGAARTLDEELIFSLIPSRCTAPAEYARLRVFALAPLPPPTVKLKVRPTESPEAVGMLDRSRYL